ncbi:hypothetical protein AKO1_008136 [Acrasis kona]|uniref:EGF-like domain-containing protein n=1 Tax=Acrasis kona TaxID=1008807 RepID=A0AAW2YPI2_9EUKA
MWSVLVIAGLLIQYASCQCNAQLPTPLIKYLLNESSGNTIRDYTNNKSSTIVGNPIVWSTQSPPGYYGSIYFNGDGSLFRIPMNGINTSQSYTLVTWIRPTSLKTYSTYLYSDPAVLYFQYHAGDQRFEMVVSPSYYRAKSSFVPTINTWYQMTGVFDSVSNTSSLYINGVLQSNVTAVSPVPSRFSYFVMGAAEGTPGNYGDSAIGYLGPMQGYQTAFTASQALQAYSLSMYPCSNNGICLNNGTCQCNYGYGGASCSYFTCFGVQMSNSSACSGNGACTSIDTCVCNSGYSGTNCQDYYCNGILNTNASVCSQNGVCTALNTCNCSSLYTGSNCDVFKCNYVFKSPVVQYLMNESTGNSIYDYINYQQSTLIGNSITWSILSPPGYNGSVYFNGSLSYFRIPTNNVSLIQSYTVTTWVRLGQYAQSTILYANNNTLNLQYNNGSKRFELIVGSTLYKAVSTFQPSLNTWYHLTGVFDSISGTISLYINGLIQNSNSAIPSSNLTYNYLTVGAAELANGSSVDRLLGYQGPIQIYGFAFTSNQALAAYSFTLQPCSGGGICNSNGSCSCSSGRTGSTCSYFTCSGITMNNNSVCSGRGVCSAFNSCVCDSGYSGNNCQISTCNGCVQDLELVYQQIYAHVHLGILELIVKTTPAMELWQVPIVYVVVKDLALPLINVIVMQDIMEYNASPIIVTEQCLMHLEYALVTEHALVLTNVHVVMDFMDRDVNLIIATV